jgi:hypothetical protein
MALAIFCTSDVPWSAPVTWRAKKKAVKSEQALTARKK